MSNFMAGRAMCETTGYSHGGYTQEYISYVIVETNSMIVMHQFLFVIVPDFPQNVLICSCRAPIKRGNCV